MVSERHIIVHDRTIVKWSWSAQVTLPTGHRKHGNQLSNQRDAQVPNVKIFMPKF